MIEFYNTPTLRRELGNYISGYVDGEGCFSVSFSIRPKLKVGWEVKPSFAVAQNFDRREVLDLMMAYFNCGHIRKNIGDKTLKYEVRSLNELLEKVIPHFLFFPLKSSKQKDFVFLKEICEKMKNFKHLEMEGFREIVSLACRMNTSGKRKYSEKMLTDSLQMKI
jgi:hypothetical protein